MSRFLNTIFILLACCIFLIPFIKPGEFMQSYVILGKYSFYTLTYLLSVWMLLSFIFQRKKWLLQLNVIDILLGCYLGYIVLIQLLLHSDFALTLHKFIGLVFSVLLYFLIRVWVINSEHDRSRFQILLVVFFIGTASTQCIIGALQIFGIFEITNSFQLPSGTFSSPVHLGFYISLALPTAVFLYLQPHSGKYAKLIKSCLMVSVFLFLFVLPKTENRASWIMSLVGCTVVFTLYYRSHIQSMLRTKIYRYLIPVVGSVVLGLGAFFLYQYKPNSADGRLLIWKIITEKGLDSPIFGHGFNEVELKYSDWQSEWFRMGNGKENEIQLADQVALSYNDYLERWVEVGAIGLLLWVAMLLFALFSPKVKSRSGSSLILNIGILVALLAGSAISYPLTSTVIQMIFFINLALLASHAQKKQVLSFNVSMPVSMGVGALVLGIFFFHFSFMKRQVTAYEDWGYYSKLYRTHSYEDALRSYERNYPILQQDILFVLEYGHLLFLLHEFEKSISVYEEAKKHFSAISLDINLANAYKEKKLYAQSESAYYNAFFISPGKFLPLYLLAKLYFESGEHQKAIHIARKIMDKEVKVDSEAIEQIKDEMQKLVLHLESNVDDKATN